jgi:hypothetical protein
MDKIETTSSIFDLVESTPEALNVACSLGINPAISAKDFIYQFQLKRMGSDPLKGMSQYYRVGRYSALLFKDEVVPEILRLRVQRGYPREITTLLDFASGYGAVARHFGQVLPELRITTCDIHGDAVEFNRSVLGLDSVRSSSDPTDLDVGKYDVIIALSFFSHMPEDTFRRWLIALSEALTKGGALVFTTRGEVSHRNSPAGVVLDKQSGFGFRPISEQHDLDKAQYGLTVSFIRFVEAAVRDCVDMRLAVFREGIWWNHQDMYVCVKS